MNGTPWVSFVVPTLNEAARLPGLLDDLSAVDLPAEVVVADGGSADGTVELARERPRVRVVAAERGRGTQMNAGARAAGGEWLCFLHADVRMDGAARRDLERAVRSRDVAAATWRLAIDGSRPVYRVLEAGARLRHLLGGLAYGDQGLLVRREAFESVDGFPDEPLFEDVAIVRALRRRGELMRFPSALRVSPRRWEREGVLRGTLRNAMLISAYLAGAPPRRLARWYRPCAP